MVKVNAVTEHLRSSQRFFLVVAKTLPNHEGKVNDVHIMISLMGVGSQMVTLQKRARQLALVHGHLHLSQQRPEKGNWLQYWLFQNLASVQL